MDINQTQQLSLLSNLDPGLMPSIVLRSTHNPQAYIPSANGLPVQCGPHEPENAHYPIRKSWQGECGQGVTIFQDSGQIDNWSNTCPSIPIPMGTENW